MNTASLFHDRYFKYYVIIVLSLKRDSIGASIRLQRLGGFEPLPNTSNNIGEMDKISDWVGRCFGNTCPPLPLMVCPGIYVEMKEKKT